MGTKRIKVIDLASETEEVTTSRKHAAKLTTASKVKKEEEKGQSPKRKIVVPKKEKEEKEPTKIQLKRKSQPKEEAAQAETIEEEKVEKVKTKSVAKEKKAEAAPKQRSKNYQTAKNLIQSDKLYTPQEAIEIIFKSPKTKFDATIEAHINVVDKKVRPKVDFPYPVGEKKEEKYLVFSEKQPKVEGKKIVWASENTIEQITDGMLKPNRDFDVVIASPKYMPQLAKVAKILGPAGMMPNPKNGTITEDPTKFFKEDKGAAQELKQDPTTPVIHTKIGKISFKQNQVQENLDSLLFAIGPSKIRKAVITSTMGPGIKLDISKTSK